MGDGPRYLGIDLGTTNSAAAVFDGHEVTPVRNRDGALLTPSVVHIDRKGRQLVGARAYRRLEKDPDNTHGGFKRLMGSDSTLSFPTTGETRTPVELSTAILKALRQDVSDALGFVPERAVISVPALFELPQTRATSEAAEAAGFQKVELIQEPVASALAAGWRADDEEQGPWLVYDLGGGTFDASLLETRDGLLRVVGHDGDNFLGGRDVDRAIVDWALQQLADDGTPIDRTDATHAPALRRLLAAAEEAKIDLSRRDEADLSVFDLFEGPDGPIDVDLTLNRSTLDRLTAPLVDRSLKVCLELLATHGLQPEDLRRVVLVGGPTVMPAVRDRVADALGVRIAQGHDPMTLVARGAALYAANAALDARPTTEEAPAPDVRRLWLQYPTLSSDLFPHVAGRLLEGSGPAPASVRFVREGWSSEWCALGADGGLVVMLELEPGAANTFRIEARGTDDAPVPIRPEAITVVQGVSLSDPPLSRTIGVALASDRVQVYLERGTPLPAKRTFSHQTIQSLPEGSEGALLTIPIVQGELERASHCRLVGRIEIGGEALPHALPSGSAVEVTLEVDRGGRLSAQALVPALDLVFEQVAHLLAPDASPDRLRDQLRTLLTRLSAVRSTAERRGDSTTIDQLYDVEWSLQDAAIALDAAQGGDDDAAQRARRTLIDADAALDTLENAQSWPQLDQEAMLEMAQTARWVEELGTQQERQIFGEVAAAAQQARAAKNGPALQRQLRVLRDLKTAAYFRHPDAWAWSFDRAASHAHHCTDVARAQQLVSEGRAAKQQGDQETLKHVTRSLWQLMPAPIQAEAGAFQSGIR